MLALLEDKLVIPHSLYLKNSSVLVAFQAFPGTSHIFESYPHPIRQYPLISYGDNQLS